ncbi:hypothetical protein AB0F52_09110 [Amycolatopsis sp. NPDC024027]|uniref:hypothetical protein n=1 Tax=Amycolatopsis sp. NPDC024027 TaxID=3154327 RepID=UPI00340E07C9
MTNDFDLPPDRPMPDHLRDALWGRVMPELAVPRRRTASAPVTVAAAVGVLAVGAAAVFGPVRDTGRNSTAVPVGTGSEAPAQAQPAPDPGDVKLVRNCVNATLAYGIAVPDRESWRPAAKIDTDTPHGFLVIRNDKAAAVCIIDDGKAVGMMGADVEEMAGRRIGYAKLTAERPFNCFTGIAGLNEPTFRFGIVTDDVTAVSLVGPDNSVHPATVRDGTFAVKINDAGRIPGSTSYRARMSLKNGHDIEAPLQ